MLSWTACQADEHSSVLLEQRRVHAREYFGTHAPGLLLNRARFVETAPAFRFRGGRLAQGLTTFAPHQHIHTPTPHTPTRKDVRARRREESAKAINHHG